MCVTKAGCFFGIGGETSFAVTHKRAISVGAVPVHTHSISGTFIHIWTRTHTHTSVILPLWGISICLNNLAIIFVTALLVEL